MSKHIIEGLIMGASDCMPLSDIPGALRRAEEIADIAEDVMRRYDGSNEKLKKWMLEGFPKFLSGCYDGVCDSEDNALTREERFKACRARIEALK